MLGNLPADQCPQKKSNPTAQDCAAHDRLGRAARLTAGIRFLAYLVTEPNAKCPERKASNNAAFHPVSRTNLPGDRVANLLSNVSRAERSAGPFGVERRD
jgi:hypothetical protein